MLCRLAVATLLLFLARGDDEQATAESTLKTPPLDFDMNAIAQIYSFPFASDSTSNPHYALITAQYDEKFADYDSQKCAMKDIDDGSEDGTKPLDTRMGTPLSDMGDKKEIYLSGLVTTSAYYRNLNASIKVHKVVVNSTCISCNCDDRSLRRYFVVAEPAFPMRLYCEACTPSEQHWPTEFYHLQNYKTQTFKLDSLDPVTFHKFYSTSEDLKPSKLPLAVWADPQYSYLYRLENFETLAAGSELPNPKFESAFPLRAIAIDRYLTTGVPPFAKNLLTDFNADGAVRILASPLPTGHPRPRHLSLACAQVKSGVAVATGSLTIVDFVSSLAVEDSELEITNPNENAVASVEDQGGEGGEGGQEPPEDNVDDPDENSDDPEEGNNGGRGDQGDQGDQGGRSDAAASEELPGGYKFDDWTMYNKNVFEGVDAKNVQLNLRLDVHFSPFSCCSACCCDKSQCGELAHSEKTCAILESVKTRYGHLVVVKAEFGNNKIGPLGNTVNEEGEKEFQKLLNEEPFKTIGLPLYSHRFRHPKWGPKLKEDQSIDASSESIQKRILTIFNKVDAKSRYVDVVNCTEEERKCENWAVCRGYKLPEVPVEPVVVVPPKCVSSAIPGLKEIKMEKDFTDVKFKIGENYRIVPEVLMSTNETIHWKVNGKVVQDMDVKKKCDEQEGVFVDINKRDLIIREVTGITSIEARTVSSGAKMTASIEKDEGLFSSSNLKYVYIIGGLAALLLILLLAFCCWWRCFRKRGAGRTSRTEASTTNKRTKKDSKEADEFSDKEGGGGGSEKEFTQNPGGSARPAWRINNQKKETPKEVKAPPAAPIDDFFATPEERAVAEKNEPIPIAPGEKDPFLIVTDQERTNAQTSDPKTERLSGPIGNNVFGIPTIPSATGAADAPIPAAPPAAGAAPGAAAIPSPIAAAAAAAVAAATDKPKQGSGEKDKEDDDKSSSKNSSSKSDRKGDDKDPKKKDKGDNKKDPKKAEADKKKKKNDKSDKKDKEKKKKGDKKKSPPKKKVSAKPKKPVKKTVTRKKK